MSDERMQVLKMLADGKITVDDAERLLARLEQVRPGPGPGAGESVPTGAGKSVATGAGELASGGGGEFVAVGSGGEPAVRSGTPKYLRVLVDSADGDKVNVRVPLALVRTGIKLTALLPSDATQKLGEKGIDFSHLAELNGEEMVEALRELNIDVDTAQGDSVRVFCE